MNQLTFEEVIRLHDALVERYGGLGGLRAPEAVKSALEQPFMTWGGQDLYASIEQKAAAVAFIIVASHPFIDGNKRTAHAMMELFLDMNGYDLHADPHEAATLFQQLAAGDSTRDELVEWLRDHAQRRS